ncbi:MAG: hypothetical protein ACSHYA_07325 [Opitutaceae bacterium]
MIGSKGSSEGDEVALRATIVFEAETSPVNSDLALNIKPSALMVNGTATLEELHGTPGLSYRVERTTDLSDSESWEVVDEIPVYITERSACPIRWRQARLLAYCLGGVVVDQLLHHTTASRGNVES